MTAPPGAAPEFIPPGAGQWSLDRSHYVGGTTPISVWLMSEAPEAAYVELFESLGVPAKTLAARFVNGFAYSRLVPLLGANSSTTKMPPAFVLWLVSRLHPEMRRRARRATKTLAEPPWPAGIAEWHERTKPKILAESDAFQKLEPAALSDDELAEHLSELLQWVRGTYEEHFRLHAWDMGPLGLLLLHTERWGADAAEVLGCLHGASPSTQAPRQALATLRGELEDHGADPSDLEAVRAVSPRAAELLDSYLDRYGDVLYNSYDLPGQRLREAPEVVLASIKNATAPVDHSTETIDEVRASLPAEHRAEFDDLLQGARSAMDLRDQNGPITVERPLGLLRRGLLELGGRLTEAGRLDDGELILNVEPDELGPLARGSATPTNETLLAREQSRRALAALNPPPTLGPDMPEPDVSPLPRDMAELVRTINALLRHLALDQESAASFDEALNTTSWPRAGIGIGSGSYTGTARLVLSADEALATLEPGEVLLVQTTSPAFNLALTTVGALVTAVGGPMSHAAVLARELGFPAVVGVGSFAGITTGDRITVDAASGEVRQA